MCTDEALIQLSVIAIVWLFALAFWGVILLLFVVCYLDKKEKIADHEKQNPPKKKNPLDRGFIQEPW